MLVILMLEVLGEEELVVVFIQQILEFLGSGDLPFRCKNFGV